MRLTQVCGLELGTREGVGGGNRQPCTIDWQQMQQEAREARKLAKLQHLT